MRAREFVAEITISGPDPRVKSYIDRMYAKFPSTWQNNHVMSWGKGDEQQLAIFELVPSLSRRGAAEIKWFQVYPLRSGVGSRAMQILQQMAQEDGIALTLYPWDRGQVSQAKLMKFYRQHGFRPAQKGSKNLVWEPSQGVAEDTDNRSLPSVNAAKQAMPRILAAAQRVYNDWDESDRDTYAGGGICHIIADAICDVLGDLGVDSSPVSCSYEQHVYVAGRFEEGIYTIDIPYHIYETGGGFSWKKIPAVTFEPRDVVFYRVSGDPDDFEQYISESVNSFSPQDLHPGLSEGLEDYNGIQLSLEVEKDDEYVNDEDTDNQTIYVKATANGRELGHVLFTIDYDSQGLVLNPQDLEVDDRYRGQGIAATMYDYVKSKGYRIRRSGQQTDAGAGFWNKHKPGKNIWEQGRAETK